MPYDLVIVGHFSKDIIITPEIRIEAMGGVPAYSLFLTKWNIKIGIVSKCGPDFLARYGERIRKAGPVLATSGDKTTEFVTKYNQDGSRTQQVATMAELIQVKDFPESFHKAKAVHFGPIINEIDTELIHNVHSTGAFVSLDPQGFCRRLERKKVIHTLWKEASEVLPSVRLLKMTEKELKLVAPSCQEQGDAIKWIMDHGTKIVIVTRGARGANIFTEEEEISIPALPTSAIDTTGAGDVFVLAFLGSFLKSRNVRDAASYSGACAALSTEVYGPTPEFEEQKLLAAVKTIKQTMNVQAR